MLPKPSLQKVLRNFDKMITDLSNVIASSDAEAAAVSERIEELKAKRQNAAAESVQASTIRSNLQALLAR